MAASASNKLLTIDPRAQSDIETTARPAIGSKLSQVWKGRFAEEAGVSKGAVYGHYKDKIAVCVAVCERGLSHLQIPHPVSGESDIQTLYRWGVEYLRQFFENPSYRNIGEILYLKCENSPEFESIRNIRITWEQRAFRVTGRLIEHAIATGEIPTGVDAYVCNVYIHSVVDGLLSTFYYADRVAPAQFMSTVENVLQIGLSGLTQPLRRLQLARGTLNDEVE